MELTDEQQQTMHDNHMLCNAAQVALRSGDPCTKVGCVITVGLATMARACNEFPKGVNVTDLRLARPTKYRFMVHAELNALALAARHGVSVAGATCYSTRTPCSTCAGALVQAGIVRVVCRPLPDTAPEHWVTDAIAASCILIEAGVQVVVIAAP